MTSVTLGPFTSYVTDGTRGGNRHCGGAARGDRAAFDRVYELYRPRLFAFLLRLSRSRTVAEDLLDETWLRLVAHAASLRPDTRLASWLFTVARNLYWTHRRSRLLEEAATAELLTL